MVKNLEELYAGLRRVHRPEDVLIIPHAHMAGDWNRTDGDMERLTELTSGHGTFEWFSNKYLANGFFVGFIGSSDNHSQHPGYTPGTNRQLGGLAAVLAPENGPQQLFDGTAQPQLLCDHRRADHRRRGLQRRPHGREAARQRATERELPGHGYRTDRSGGSGQERNDHLLQELHRAGAFTERPGHGQGGVLVRGLRGPTQPSRTAALACEDRGPGGRLVGFTRPWFFNPATFVVERDAEDPNALILRTNTRGRAKGLLLELDDVTENTEVVVSLGEVREAPSPGGYGERSPQRIPESTATFRVGDLVGGPTVHEIPVVRHIDTVAARLLPGDAALDQRFEYVDLADPVAGDYYYVRVTQVIEAWSSPVWFGEPTAQ